MADPLIARAQGALAQMSARERRLVMITAAVAVVLIVFGVGSLIGSAIEKRQKRIRIRTDEIAQLEALRGRYDEAVQKELAATRRIRSAASTSLFSLLQKAATGLGIPLSDLNERRLPVKDSELSELTVDVTLKEVSMDKLVNLLEKIEGGSTAGVVKVTKLKAKTRFDQPDLLEVSLTVSTWKAPSGSGEGKTP